MEELLASINDVINDGKDLDNFLWETIKYIKDVLIYKVTGKAELYNSQEIENISELSKKAEKEKLFKLIYTLSELANNIKWSTQKTIVLQAGLIKCCMPEIKIVQNNVGAGLVPAQKKTNTGVEPVSAQKKTENMKPEQKNKIVGTNGEYATYWNKILDELKTKGKVMLYTNLIGTRAKKSNDMCVNIEFSGKITPFAKTVLEQHENREELSKMVSLEEGQKMQIKYIENANVGADSISAEAQEDIDIKINIIDE